jgi:putative PIN family toxin of toxin-antitoxin system
MRAVLDTNVLISGLLWRGAPYECLMSAEAGLYELILADEILEELRAKLVNKFRMPVDEVNEILEGLRVCAEVVQIHGRSGWIPDDPDDDKFVETAIVAHANAIVSGDRHLLALGSLDRIEILTPRGFLQRIVEG